MTGRILVAVAILAVVVAVAAVARRRRPVAAPAGPAVVPRQLHRADFPRPDAPWLVAYFWSRTCDGCATLAPKVAVLESAAVATCALEAHTDAELHRRYEIAGVPLVVVADAEGVVVRAFLGSFTATDLWAAVAEARNPGSGPESGLGSLDQFA